VEQEKFLLLQTHQFKEQGVVEEDHIHAWEQHEDQVVLEVEVKELVELLPLVLEQSTQGAAVVEQDLHLAFYKIMVVMVEVE
jgi:hypothetical protein